MELNQVRYFVALARLLSFTRAAEHCNVTQPALTKAIQKLEDEFGDALIHRERRLTQLTELGLRVLPMLEQTLAAADHAKAIASEYERNDIAVLKIALTPGVSADLLLEPVRAVIACLPRIEVEFLESPSEELSDLLLAGHANVAIDGDGNAGSLQRIDQWPLFDERHVLLAAASDTIAEMSTVPVSVLPALTWVERIGCPVTAAFWRDVFPLGVGVKVSCRSRSLSHLQHLTAAGFGVLIVPAHVLPFANTVGRPVADQSLQRTVRMLAVAGRKYTAAQEAFIRIARSYDWRRARSPLTEAL